MPLVFNHSTSAQRVLFGAGHLLENTRLATQSLGASRILLIADAFARDLADGVASAILVVARIDEVVQHVPVENARAAVEVAISVNADAVVSIGGGSSTGLAKMVARELDVPIIAVPTTFAGSEATEVWGHTENERKVTGRDPRVLPKVVVYDPDLLSDLPAALVVSSGLNAVAHAVDGFWAPDADPINRALGTEGLRALIPSLRALHQNPGDTDARELALYGAYLAGVAFSSAGSGMHHKICHVLGGTYSLSHSDTHAIVLPYVTAFNAPSAPDAAQRISSILNASPARGLYDLKAELGIPKGLSDIGMPEALIPEAARLSVAAIPASNPRPATVEDVEHIIRSAWSGEPIR